MSPLAYSDHRETPFELVHGTGRRPSLHLAREGADTDEVADTDRLAEVTPHLAHRVGLTPRDVVVLGFLAQGCTTAQIAHTLAYAESTIKKEVHLIVHRLGAHNRTHAVALAIRGAVI